MCDVNSVDRTAVPEHPYPWWGGVPQHPGRYVLCSACGGVLLWSVWWVGVVLFVLCNLLFVVCKLFGGLVMAPVLLPHQDSRPMFRSARRIALSLFAVPWLLSGQRFLVFA